jgi:hypothetical protein
MITEVLIDIRSLLRPPRWSSPRLARSSTTRAILSRGLRHLIRSLTETWHAASTPSSHPSYSCGRARLPSYTEADADDSRFFLAEYLTWRTEAKATSFAASFKRFAQAIR